MLRKIRMASGLNESVGKRFGSDMAVSERVVLSHGKLAVHEEFPDAVAEAVRSFLRRDAVVSQLTDDMESARTEVSQRNA